MMLCPAYIGHLWIHREESNLQPTDYKTVALPVELRWHMCAVPLRLSRPSLGGDIMISHSQGSFQRDSAGSYRPTQASGFHGWERPNIAGGLSCTAWRSPCFWLLHIGGFRLYTLRRAQPLFMCRHTGAGHSCHRFRLHDRRASLPFSGAVRRSRLPGIVSFHCHLPHGGRDPPPSLSGGFQPCSILHTVGAATAPSPPRPCEGGWKRNLADMGKYLSSFIIPQYIRFNQVIIHNILCFKMDGGTPLLCSLRVAEHTQQTLPKHQEHHHAYFYLPSYTRKGS